MKTRLNYLPVDKNRRNSIIEIKSSTGEIVDTLTFVSLLGSGTFGEVRKFSSDKISVAVKSPKLKNGHRYSEGTEAHSLREAISPEFYFLQKAYSNEEPLHIFHISDSMDDKYSYRMVQPIIDNPNILKFTKSLDNPVDLLMLFQCLVTEVNRIHALGIIHGDLNEINIRAGRDKSGQIEVRLIDFGAAYDANDGAIIGTNAKHSTCLWFAPERTEISSRPEELTPHSNQDVYSIGFVLKLLAKEWRWQALGIRCVFDFPELQIRFS